MPSESGDWFSDGIAREVSETDCIVETRLFMAIESNRRVVSFGQHAVRCLMCHPLLKHIKLGESI